MTAKSSRCVSPKTITFWDTKKQNHAAEIGPLDLLDLGRLALAGGVRRPSACQKLQTSNDQYRRHQQPISAQH